MLCILFSFGRTDSSSSTRHTAAVLHDGVQLPSTVEECTALINELKLTNQQQNHEVRESIKNLAYINCRYTCTCTHIYVVVLYLHTYMYIN